jgi:hypothetical protein
VSKSKGCEQFKGDPSAQRAIAGDVELSFAASTNNQKEIP